MADHLLEHGMAAASLRPLATAVGTSDRMLLYYFASKDELVAATLERVAGRLTVILDRAIPTGTRLPPPELLLAIWSAVGSVELRPYMRLWLELAAASARGREPQRAIAAAITDGFVRWTGDHLFVDRRADRERACASLLATVEGALFLDAIGRRDLADMAVRNGAVADGAARP
ncbi:TetR family transcriptional regulator [Sphingomonas lenta]|uniref:TetR family transcriptional regulator n=2 Tax=Sphingomonas lenta TaxID=1141887 RepID=A0A2A2SCZ6_9SPHN|nr:TetR family transcriptional regulator [Sphingomonas lenta]